MDKLLFEVSIGGIDDVILAQKYGVDRIELNIGLRLGGLTPSLALCEKTRELYDGTIIAMIRTRGGGFRYTEKEMKIHYRDIEILSPWVDGFVFGCLNEDLKIDKDILKKVRELTLTKKLAFHRAFDLVDDMDEAIKTLIECKVDRVLTAGVKYSVNEGWENLRYLQSSYGNDIEVLAGGGIVVENIIDMHQKTGITQFHGSLQGKMFDIDTNNGVSYKIVAEENYYDCVDEAKLSEMIKLIK